MTADFIGAGVAFPLRVDHTGRVAMSTGAEALEQAMVAIISTAKGERVMRPDFGCAIWEDVFESINATTLGRIEQHVREALGQWEPRAVIEDVRATPVDDGSSYDGRVDIAVRYTIRDRNETRNLVYPFYVIPED